MSRSKLRFISLTVVVVITLVIGGCSRMQQSTFNPPDTEIWPVIDTLHGMVIEDPYRWLEDQQAPQTRAWIEAQNEYTRLVAAGFPGVEKLKNRFSEMLRAEKVEEPLERGGRYFLRKRPVDKEQFLIYVRDGLHGDDRILVDPHGMAADQCVSAEICDVSADGELLAYAVRRGGEDETAIRFLEVSSGMELSDSLPRGLYFGYCINADKSGLYYVKVEGDGARVFYHRFGTDLSSDRVVFGGQYTPSEWMTISMSEDRRFLLIEVSFGSSGDKCELYVKDVKRDGPVTTIVKDVEAGFFGTIGGDKVYVVTNYKAPNWCLYAADIANPAMDRWKLIVPEREDAVAEACGLAGRKLFVNYLEDGSSRIRIFEPDGKPAGELELPALGSAGKVKGEWSGTDAFYSYSSFNVPETIYHLNVATGETDIWHRPQVSVVGDKIEIQRVWYESKDGTRVPMWLAHRKGIKLDGTNPTYLTGYGGFNLGITPKFRESYLVWLEMGGLLAYPCLRGGNEFGEEWHRAAQFEKKQNTFDDFIAAAEWLIANQYTTAEKLAIRGGSNGGLLVGAVMNQRPDLFKAVICGYPLLDMVRYHKFLMGPYWVTEYGSPDNPQHFEFIYKYSPYHNVKKGVDYPAVLYVTGDCDTRVAPLHARKMTALMQATVGTKSPVLLLYDTEAGHAGDAAVHKDVEEQSLQMGFLAWQLGVQP